MRPYDNPMPQPEIQQPEFSGSNDKVKLPAGGQFVSGQWTATATGKLSGTTPTTSPDTKKRQRKSKNETGVWVVEKSLDKKSWVPEVMQKTRASATEIVNACAINDYGIHYRVTRYEPTR